MGIIVLDCFQYVLSISPHLCHFELVEKSGNEQKVSAATDLSTRITSLEMTRGKVMYKFEMALNMNRGYNYYVYIMASISKVLYIGVTNDIQRRVEEHRRGEVEGFTKKYKCTKLVYYEHFNNIEDAIMREKKLKKWRREKKILLIEEKNPQWNDISLMW